MKFTKLSIINVGALLLISLAGCGGGGNASSGSSGGTSTPPINTTSTLTGVAAKGLLIGANVNIYCGNASGASLWSGTTGVNGNYSASWAAACSQPLLVSLTTSSTTIMISDITGLSVPVPANFTLRAYVSAPSTTIAQNVTPFTDMAATITDKLSGTSAPTASQVSNAISAIVNTVLNGQQAVYNATPVMPSQLTSSSPASAQELSALLTALMEQANVLGGVDKLMTAINTQLAQEITISASGTVNYNNNIGTPANDPIALIQTGLTLAAHDVKVTNPIVQTLVTSTSLVGNNCTTSGCVVTGVTDPIPAATALLNSVRTELTTDFSTLGANTNKTGFLQTQFAAMQQDANNITTSSSLFLESKSSVQATLNMLRLLNTINNIAATSGLPGPMMYDSTNTIFNVSNTDPNLGIFFSSTQPFNNAIDPFTGQAATIYVSYNYGYACYVASDAMNAIWCAIDTNYNGNPNFTEYSSSNPSGYLSYVVRVVANTLPTASQSITSSFTWSDFLWETTMPTTIPAGGTLPTGMTGTGNFTLTAANSIPAISFKGKVFPMLSSADATSINASIATTSTSTGQTQTVSGSAVTTSNGSPVLTIAIASGSQATRDTSGSLMTYNFGLIASTPLYQYIGNLTVNYSGLDASQTKQGISKALFTISASNIGASNPFFSGSLSAATSNWSKFNSTLPLSSTNYPQATATLTGTLVDGSNTVALTTSATTIGGTYGKDANLTITYNKNGSPVIAGSGTVKIDSSNKVAAGTNAQFSSGPTAINLNYNGTAISGNVTNNTTVIGTINIGTNQVNFTDGTFISLY